MAEASDASLISIVASSFVFEDNFTLGFPKVAVESCEGMALALASSSSDLPSVGTLFTLHEEIERVRNHKCSCDQRNLEKFICSGC